MDLIALAAAGAIPGLDGGGASDEWEAGEGVEGAIALRKEAVDAVGAGDSGKRADALVVFGVVGDGDGLACFGGWGWAGWDWR